MPARIATIFISPTLPLRPTPASSASAGDTSSFPTLRRTLCTRPARGIAAWKKSPRSTIAALPEVAVTVYSCPSRGQRHGVTPDGWILPLGDYAGVIMSWMGDQYRNSYAYNSPAGVAYQKYGWRGIIAKGGHFNGTTYTQWKKINAKDVTDGTSKTIAIMEKAVWSGRYEPNNWDDGWSDMPGWPHNAHQATMRSMAGDGRPGLGRQRQRGHIGTRQRAAGRERRHGDDQRRVAALRLPIKASAPPIPPGFLPCSAMDRYERLATKWMPRWGARFSAWVAATMVCQSAKASIESRGVDIDASSPLRVG